MTVRKETVLIEQIDKLIKAFGQLDSLEKPKPSKETWQKAEQLAQKEYEEKQRKNALAMGLSSTPSTAKSPLQTKVPDKLIERKCLEIDEKYRAALSQSGEQTKETAKQIGSTLYPIQGRLLEFHRAKRTLLKENWDQLRQNFGLEKVFEFQRQGRFAQAVDALEAIKGKIDYQEEQLRKVYQRSYNVALQEQLEKRKAELARVRTPEKPTEIKQDIAPVKRRRIWTCIKKALKISGAIIAFLAALLTIFYYLGWLEPIKEFIDKILSGK